MDLDFTPEQEMIRDTYRRFCDKELTPEYVRWVDENCNFLPEDMLGKFAALGTQGLTVPEEYGGQGLGMIEFSIVLEEISKKSVAAAFCVGGGLAFGARPILDLGTPLLRERHLPRIAGGEEKWSLAMSEPGGGTDILGAIRTTAVRKGDRYVVNGSKQWITAAHVADYMTTVVITDPAAPRKKGLSALIIDARAPGVTVKPIPKLGIHGCGTNAVFFDDVAVPVENLLGTENNGWYQLLNTLNPERIATSMFSLGLAQAAFDYALAYAKERHAFGRPIGAFQILQHYLADIAIEIQLSRNLIYRCAWLADNGRPYNVEVAMAKIAACRASELAARHGMEILGGYGFAMEYDMQRHFRDYKQMMFSPISDEMAKNYIAESFGLPRSF
ncbi:MAG: acyl-CoA/acyl-ACP dehydrogenase [Betaproteobacteria bacterium]|nr:acyl-CoA/acyl-ACP dehydrogenase [Betaproteobacteria bacterium]